MENTEEDSEYQDSSETVSDSVFQKGFIGVHIGAGRHSRKLKAQYYRLVGRACREGVRLLRNGGSALDAVEAATVVLEDSPLTNAGRGSTLTADGRVEADASIMCGDTLRWCGVGAVPGVRNPIKMARRMVQRLDTQHPLGLVQPCLLVGTGARKWAREQGLDVVAGKHLISGRALKYFKKYRSRLDQFSSRLGHENIRHFDTVGVVALDDSGKMASACSSGGIALKYPGRSGQAAVYGSGAWAEQGSGATPNVAVTTSGCGEHLIRSGLAQNVAADVPQGNCPTAGLHSAMKTHFLESKFLKTVPAPLGGVLYLQHDPVSGAGDLLWAHTTASMCVGYMGTENRRPSAALSTLPFGNLPGHSVVVHGTCFRTCVKSESVVPKDTSTDVA